jgi:capsular exopolysaccharide synthesis family protein
VVGPRSIDPIRVLRRHLAMIFVSVVFGGVIGMAAHVALERYYPLFSGEVLFEVQPGISKADDVGANEFANDDVVLRIGNTQTFLLTSREVLSSALAGLEIRETEWHKQFIKKGTFDNDAAIDALQEELRAGAVRGSNVFRLSWSSHYPRDIPTVLNNVKKEYLRKRDELDTSVYRNNVDVFQSQLSSTQRELTTLTEQIKTYVRDKGITTFTDPTQSDIGRVVFKLSEDIADMTSALSMTTTAYEQTANKLQGSMQPTSDDIVRAEENPRMLAYAQQELGLKTDLRVALDKYQPDHPVPVEINRRLKATQFEREAELQELVRRNLESRLKLQADEIERIRRALTEMEEEFEAKQIDLSELTADTTEYETLVTRQQFLELRRDADQALINDIYLMRVRADASRVRVLQDAVEPREASFPKIYIIVPLGVMAVTGLTIGLIFLRELTDQRVKSASDLSVIPGSRVLGVIPERDEDPTRVDSPELAVRRFPNSVLAESYRQATTSICREFDRSGHQTLVLVGGLPAAGTTTLATNIAAASANFGRRVLLVDANFRRPRLAEAMGFDSGHLGLGDLLAGSATVDEAIITDDETVHVLSVGTPANRLFERLNSPEFDNLLAELRGRYDLVIFDTAPCVVAGDAIILANKTDASVLIVRAHQEYRGLVSRISHQLMESRSDFLGMVLNRPRGTAGGYLKKNYAAMAQYTAVKRRKKS